ncbi:hypothetical protein C0991_003644 [Blastosporella zonata]|nr:hypothetical protein C0991_003644 [Blastosporella zonata]
MSVNGIRGSKGQEIAGQAHVKGGGGGKQGKTRGKTRRGSKKISAVTQEVLEEERADLITQKQTQLEKVVDRHDTLEAKTDNTKVFQNYKSTLFSLVDSSAAGPSRSTRRTRTEQAQLPKVPSISAPIPAPISTTIPAKRQLKARTNTELPESIDLDAKKGKGRVLETPPGHDTGIFDGDPPTTGQSISALYVRKQPEQLDHDVATSPHPTKKRKSTEHKAEESISIKSRRSSRLKPPEDVALNDAKESVDLMLMPPSKPIKSTHLAPMTIFATPSQKSNIKRIKLVVRRPPPPLTNPKQRPPPAQHNSSVDNFLNSYFTLEDQDVEEKALQEKVKTDASILERAERLRAHGGFLPILDQSFAINGENMGTSLTPPRPTTDHWDHIIDAACHVSRVWRKRPSGQHIAGQWAKAVRGYWDGQEVMKERLVAQEERRLRALAKATIRMVTDEWKKAVFHIREQERLKQEAEEIRRGREHLDAILDQSGQLLETQQGDLTRGENRSRSSSISLTHRGWGSDEEEEDDEDEEDNEEDHEEVATDGLSEAREETFEEPASDFEDGLSQLADVDDVDMDDTQTQMLLGGSDVAPTAASTPSAVNIEASDANLSDDEIHVDDSSVAAVDESLTALPFSSPQRPRHPSPGLVTEPEPFASPDLVKPTIPSEASLPEFATTDLARYSQATSPVRAPIPLDPSEQSDMKGCDNLHSSPSLERSEEESPPQNSPNLDDELSENPLEGLPSKLPTKISKSCPNGAAASPISGLPSPTPSGPDNEAYECEILIATEEPSGLTEKDDDSVEVPVDEVASEAELDDDVIVPAYLKPFAVAPVEWIPDTKITPPLLLRGNLRPYQHSGLEWLASLHSNNLNGILADEMGLGKTIQTIALLAHLACDRGIWGPHLIVVPTSVLLNWEMEFKKFLPGFKVLSYHGSQKRRKELRQGWSDKHHFNVCVTSYTLASRDAHIFKRKAWYYLILDEAHMIKNFKSQRWNILLMFRSFRRLLLTGTPLQNNLTELWALLQFLMSGSNFATLKDFGDWFSNPVEKAIEMGNADDDDTMQRVAKLHTVLRPYLLRRLKRDVEKELPSKYEHLVMCPLSKRQRFLYDEFMARAHTREALQSGVYQKIANILMQLRKVCNHPDLFEVRPIVTSFAMERSAVADFEIKELLVRRRLLQDSENTLDLHALGLKFIDNEGHSSITATMTRQLDATALLPFISESPGEQQPKDLRTIAGFRKYSAYLQRASTIARWSHIGYLNRLRCNTKPIYSSEVLAVAAKFYEPILPASCFVDRRPDWESIRVMNSMVKSYITRAEESASVVEKFAFVTPAAVALQLPHITLSGCEAIVADQPAAFDDILHKASVKLQIAFPDPSLLQYDCGKLQELTRLLREKKAGGHRILIFTQMTKILDILEIFLNFHGYLYLRLDGATKIEDRQYITERFNADPRIFCFIASSRSGGVGINLTGADTVVFYDSDFNPQMDKQCEDRAHRIGQIRDVHIYRFVSQHTVEEALLRKANQKRSLDDLVIQKGEFDWRSLFNDQSALSKALEEFEDREDVHAAAVATTEEVVMQGADEADFGGEVGDSLATGNQEAPEPPSQTKGTTTPHEELEPEDEAEGGSIVDFMVAFVQEDLEFFKDWRL